MAQIHTIITVKDYKESEYLDTYNCALAKTIKRVMKVRELRVGGTVLHLNGEVYSIKGILPDIIMAECKEENPTQTPIVIDTIARTVSVDKSK